MSTVVAVCRSGSHSFSKDVVDEVWLVAGLGVDGDAHAGATVQHLSRVRRDPTQPNLRQVHLMHRELFDQLAASGFAVGPGDMGENVTTEGVDLLALPTGAVLRLGSDAVVRVTGLRNPCVQLNRLADGLMARLVHRADDGSTVREAGVMAVVETGGVVRAGDPIVVELPSDTVEPLEPV
jgi:MOSC domain-containing protein YiiM